MRPLLVVLALAAAAAHSRGAVLLVVMVIGLGYLAAAAWWPFRRHRRCSGTGRLRSPSGRAWRSCPGCKGTGRKLRLGRQLWGALKRTTTR